MCTTGTDRPSTPSVRMIPKRFGSIACAATAFLVGTSALSVTCQAETTVLYVSPTGDDSHTGRLAETNQAGTDGPFATLRRARDEIRQLKSLDPATDFRVRVCGGDHFLDDTLTLTDQDSGSLAHPICYEAVSDAVPRLIGGKQVSGFRHHNEHVLVADLAPDELPNADFFKQLFYEGERQVLARYPNFDPKHPYSGGWAYVAGEPIPMYQNIPDEPRNQFTMKPQDLRLWARPTEGWVFVFPRYNWWNNWSRIKSLDRVSGGVVLERNASYPIRPNDRYYVYNLFEELDVAGEWYYDRRAAKLYFYPPDEMGFTGKVTIPTLSTLIRCEGARHVQFRGLSCEVSRGAAFELVKCEHVRIAGCTVRNVGTAGIVIRSSQECGAVGCDIYSIGTTAVSLNGGDRETLSPGNNFADNNYIHHTGVFYKQGVGVGLSGVGNRASHNLIHDCPRFAIQISGNDQIIEWNHLRHLNLETCDTGATYSGGRDWISPRGTVIRYNYIHDIFGFGKEHHSTGRWISPHYCWGIYLDDNSAEVKVYGNIVVRALRGLLHFHCARDNLVENNIFVDGLLQQIEMNGWSDYSRFMDRMAPAYEKYSSLPAWKKYPGLQAGGHPRDAIPMGGNRIRRNIIAYSAPAAKLYKYRRNVTRFLDDFDCDHNLIWHHDEPILVDGLSEDLPDTEQWAAWREMGFDQHSIVADPLFVDAANDDYRLRPNSPAEQIGFEPIQMAEIGPYASSDRASWPILEAAGAREFGMQKVVPIVP
jgi:hypothetical protein